MANIIKPKRSNTASLVPTTSNLTSGEIGVNMADQKIYINNGTSVVQIGAGNLSSLGDTNITTPSNGQNLTYDSVSGKWINSTSAGSGDVVGPSSATDNALVRFDTTTGKLIQNGNITEDDNGNLSNVNGILFDTTPSPEPTATGAIFWDAGNGTPSVILDADVTLQLGQENLVKVYNGTGSTISNGKIVAVSGAQGQRPSVVLADADTEPLSAATLGITTESIANGAEGFVTTFGLVRGLDTSAFTAGAPIYLSSTAGAFTATKPVAPAHTVFLGWVISVNASSGEVFVNISNGWELDELHNVLITSPASGNTLIYDASAGVWKNANLTQGTGITITNGAGSISIANAGVTSFSAGTTGLTPNSATTGAVTLAGTLAIANGGTGQTTKAAAFNALSPITTLGDVIYGDGANSNTRLAGNITTTRQFLRQTGTGTVSAAPAWDTVTKTDVGLSNVENTALSTWAGSTNITTLGTVGTGTWNATTIGVSKGGTGLTSISALSVPVANSSNTYTTVTGTAGQSIRVNAGGTAWEAYTPTSGTVTSVGATSPVASSGGTTPTISLNSAYGDTLNPYGSKTANYVLAAPNGSAGVPTFRAIVAADIPTLNQNTTGTASNVTGTVAIANGGSGQTTAQAAMNAFAGAVTSGSYLRGNGTNVVMSTIQAADVPTLNQNTTGTASNVTGTVAVTNGGTGLTSISALSVPVANSANTYTTVTGTAGQSIRVNAGGTAWEAYTPSTASGTVTSVAALTLGTTGTDLSSTVANSTTTPVITLNVPNASATNRGALTSTDWSTFNGKQAAYANLTSIGSLANGTGWLYNNGSGTFSYSTPTASNVGLGNVTNDTQTKAAIVPNTTPTAGQILVGNAGGTAYAPVSMSGDATLSSTGAITLATVPISKGGTGQTTSYAGFNALSSGTTSITNSFAFSAGNFASAGDAQFGQYILRGTTTSATPLVLTTDALTAGTTNQVILPNDSTYSFIILIAARRTDVDNESAGFKFEGVIDRNTTAATTAIVGTVSKNILAEDTAAWDVNITADTTNGGLAITVTGEAAKTIRWVATVLTTQVTG